MLREINRTLSVDPLSMEGQVSVPEGRLIRPPYPVALTRATPSQPSLRDAVRLGFGPGVETPGYSQKSLRDMTWFNPNLSQR